jgi:hypothetical protein
MNNKGYTTKQLLIVIIGLGIFTLGLFGATSYAYKDNSEEYYKEKVNLMEKQAVLYASTLEKLKEDNNTVITLDEMVEAGYYIADNDDGDVIDPRNTKATLNKTKIKISYENEEYKAKVIEDE